MKGWWYSLLVGGCLQAQTWTQLADFPSTSRDDGVGVVCNGTWYVGTGQRNGAGPANDFYVFNPQAATFSSIATLPGAPRQYACTFNYNEVFYVFGGDAGGTQNDLYQYSTASLQWVKKANRPGPGNMAAVAFSFDNKGVVACGRAADQTATAEVWWYDMGNDSWTKKNDVPFIPVWRAAGATYNGYGYLAGGITANGKFNKYLYKYDPINDSWSQEATLPNNQGYAYASLVPYGQGLVLLCGHDSLYKCTSGVWYYHVQQKTWSQLTAFSGAVRKGGMSAVLNGKIYYTCGIDQSNVRLNETWVYSDPVALSKETLRDIKCYINSAKKALVINGPALPFTYEIIDVNGSVQLSGTGHQSPFEIDAHDLHGVMIVRLITKEGVFYKKFIGE